MGNGYRPNWSMEVHTDMAVAAETQDAEMEDAGNNAENEVVSGDEVSVQTDDLSGSEVVPVTETVNEEEPVTYEFCEVDATYFDNALFIGDSRTDGLSRYGGLGEADVFASTGMNIYQLWNSEVMDENKELITLEDMLEQNDYSKIYITLGINEIDYSQKKTVERFTETIEKLQEYEPGAIIFLQSNLHVSKKRSSSDKIYNNDKINSLNEKIALLADNTDIFYIDCNELFNDDNGCLKADLTYDGIHVYKKYYPEWVAWLLTKGIVKEDTSVTQEAIAEEAVTQEPVTEVTVTEEPITDATVTEEPVTDATEEVKVEVTQDVNVEASQEVKAEALQEGNVEASKEVKADASQGAIVE